MTAYHSTAVGATPFCFFFFQKRPDAVRFYEIEVCYHAHMVFGAIPFIEGLEPTAGVIRTFIAESHETFTQPGTRLFHKGTVLAAWQTAGTIRFTKPLLIQIVCHRQVADAHSAVHPARGNKFLFHFQ